MSNLLALNDRFGRPIDYLRISLTDRCNLRCRYCMPIHDPLHAPREDVLSAGEIEVVVRAAAGLGFRKVRLTGGEPTLRHDVVDIVRRVAGVPGIRDVSMTTNGIRLPELATDLKAAGLTRVNVHIDSLDPERLAGLMRWGRLEALWAGLEAAEGAGLTPIKLNCVVAKGYNEEDVVDLARLTLSHSWTVRFIELMPLGSGKEAQFSIDRYVPNPEVKARIEASVGPLTPLAATDPSDESANFQWAGAPGVVGFISPVSAPYCGTCNRMRLTADGKLHLCLLHDAELDLRPALGRAEPPAGKAEQALGRVEQAADRAPLWVGDRVPAAETPLASAVARSMPHLAVRLIGGNGKAIGGGSGSGGNGKGGNGNGSENLDNTSLASIERGVDENDPRIAAVAELLERAVAAKPTGHALAAGVHTEGRRMHAIGG